MKTAPAPSPVSAETSADELCHLYCCDPTTAWCGTDISGMADVDSAVPADCVVCADLEDQLPPCPTCGA